MINWTADVLILSEVISDGLYSFTEVFMLWMLHFGSQKRITNSYIT